MFSNILPYLSGELMRCSYRDEVVVTENRFFRSHQKTGTLFILTGSCHVAQAIIQWNTCIPFFAIKELRVDRKIYYVLCCDAELQAVQQCFPKFDLRLKRGRIFICGVGIFYTVPK
jgi:hypothetical protein